MRTVRAYFVVAAAVIASSGAWAADALALPEVGPEDVFGFTLYTLHDDTLKMTAQFYPLPEDASRTCKLEVRDDGKWVEVAKAEINPQGWTALFRVQFKQYDGDVTYRVNYRDTAFKQGVVRANPAYKDSVSVAMFTGNSIAPPHGGDIPKTDLVANVQKLDPDLLFFSGDQVYHHRRHYDAWMKFGRDFGDLLCNYPSVCLPDDHDVGQANLWGASGKKSALESGDDGGYFAPPEYVREVERAQTSHLPDPYDPTPVQRGIGVYYTELNIGGVSFAILEDRKFKTGPRGLVPEMGPRPDHVTTPDYDPKALDVPEAVLLGARQLAFLEDWARDWKDAYMKAVLSQTVFAGAAHLHGKYDNRLYVDLDCNGWPQTGRNKALSTIRTACGVMLCGDQHLATLLQHGVDTWQDAGYSFSVPSIANLYLRWWDPLEEGKNRPEGAPPYLGDFLDGLGNHITMHAVANPSREKNGGKALTTRAAGFGLTTFDNRARTITFNCWPRNVDVGDPTTRQYEGWPKTVNQLDNLGPNVVGRLPAVQAQDGEPPIVQVLHEETGEIVYTLRAPDSSFAPPVYEAGTYSLIVRSGDNVERREGLVVAAD